MIVNVADFNFSIVGALEDLPRKAGNQSTRARVVYKDAVCAFDIETTYLSDIDCAVLYIWQFQLDEGLTIIGRTWEEFLHFYNRVCEVIPEGVYLVVYVHNLSYEFQFMRSLFSISPEDVFVVKSRRILRWRVGRFEFRCSYLQTNLSLDALTEKFHVKHQKLDGQKFDYSKIRYSDTPLTKLELQYCINDVNGLVEAINAEMERDNDNLYTIPLTSTGYVRRDIKAALRDWGTYRVKELLPDADVYTLLREAFRGGNTHANRYFVKQPDFPLQPIENLQNADRSSSYPDVQVNYPFPMTPFRHVEKSVTYSELKAHYIEKRGYALLFRMEITDLRLRDRHYPCPYLSYDKARAVRGKLLDNGRLLSAAHCEITVTDIDFKIIDKQYALSDENVNITDLYFAHYDYLPMQLRNLVKHYYEQKTALKNVEGQEIFYDKFKALINAVYGCSAQDPAKENIQYMEDGTPNDEDSIYVSDGRTVEEILYDPKNHPAMPYQWGVWTTARARECLQIMIDAVHETEGTHFVYTDTDSVKYVGRFDLETINSSLRKTAIKNGAYADDIKGKRHYMGVFEEEPPYPKFQTMGAKSYIYEDENGRMHITIAGVPKNKGARELEKMGGFDAYHVGTVFKEGITETRYDDKRRYEKTVHNGHPIEITSNMIIRDSFHKIGYSKDYATLLDTLTEEDIDMATQ